MPATGILPTAPAFKSVDLPAQPSSKTLGVYDSRPLYRALQRFCPGAVTPAAAPVGYNPFLELSCSCVGWTIRCTGNSFIAASIR